MAMPMTTSVRRRGGVLLHDHLSRRQTEYICFCSKFEHFFLLLQKSAGKKIETVEILLLRVSLYYYSVAIKIRSDRKLLEW